MAFGSSFGQARLSPTSTNRSFAVTPAEQARVDRINANRKSVGELAQFGTKASAEDILFMLRSPQLGGTGGVDRSKGQTVGGIPGAGAGTFGVEGPMTRSGPSALLASRGSVSRQFLTGGPGVGGSGGGGGSQLGGGGGGDPSQHVSVTRNESDIQDQLEPLLSEIIASGGTDQARAASASRAAATDTLMATLQELTPQAAEARAQGAIDAVVRRSLEAGLPAIQGAAEAAGTSQDALQALQINDLAARTGEAAAVVLLSAITDFATSQAQVGGVVEDLSARDPVSDELISLLTSTPSETQNRTFQGNLGLFDEGSETAALLASLGITPENIQGITAGAAAPGGGGFTGTTRLARG